MLNYIKRFFFLHLLRQLCGSHISFHHYGVSHWLICLCWTSFVTLEGVQLDYGVWSFQGAAQHGGVEGCVLISCKNSKSTTCCWITIDRRMLDPTTKGHPHPTAKEKPQKDGRRGKIAFRIKPCIHQRCLEDSNKTLCAPGPRDHTDWARPSFECLSVSCRNTGQQWPTTGEGTLGAADLGHTAGGISPLGGGRH